MAKHMRVWVVGALLLAVGGMVVASNMGFKWVPDLNTGGVYYAVGIPLNHNYTNADSILADVNGSGCSAAFVEKVVPSAGGAVRRTWSGSGTADQNFPVAAGEGYFVQVNSSCGTWTIVGSHNPSFQYNFSTPGVAYLVGIPYHTTATVAEDLRLSIPNIAFVERVVPSAGGAVRRTWTGSGTADQNFAVNIGEAYIVQVNSATTWTPAHY